MDNEELNEHRIKNSISLSKVIFMIIFLFCIAFGMIFIYKLIKHENNQNILIQNLQNNITKLELKINILSKENNQYEYLDDGYNFFALGNSITIHEKNSYWWDEIGMAASEKNNDYVHLVYDYLNKKINTKFYAYNFFIWENMHYDRGETLDLLLPYMSDKLNLVIIQLSENVSNFDNYKSDYLDLIDYIKSKCSNAQIIIIDDFWDDGYKSKVKKEICDEFNIDFVDLSKIKNDKNYMSSLGNIVYDAKGNEHIIEHSGVAEHPGDKGMKYIADKIIEKIN